ncbi:DMT family transporter [Nesterenkonia flava]|uniref:DMT family transporter n=1 Tax=Nesterenkonia flava TaxID=469799 RepID=UPI00286E9F30|nr:DMT family transporter [Nesterenkonia flava]
MNSAARPSASSYASQGVILMLVGTLALAGSAAMISAIDAEPISTAAWRCLLAVPMLLPFALWELGRVERSAALPRATLVGAVVAGVAIGVDYSFYNTSILLIGAGIATVLINIQLVILPLIAWMVEGVRPMPALAWIVPLMLLGVALTAGAFDAGSLNLTGVLAGLAAGTGYALYLAIIRRTAPPTLRPAPFTVLAIVCLSAGLVTLVAALASGRLTVPQGTGWLWFLALAFVGQVVTYLCFNIAMTRVSETTSSTLMLLSAVFALGFGVVLFDQVPTLWQLLGCAMIIAGAWFASVRSARRG